MRPIQSLVSPRLDFWFLGGLSICVWGLLHFVQLPPFNGLLILVLFSFPHLAASQWLCYSRGKDFILRNWPELIAVPLVLLSALVLVGLFFEGIGPQAQRLFCTVFIFSSGWHFAMQAFGACVISARNDQRPLESVQRTALKSSVLTLWIYFFISRFNVPIDRSILGIEIFYIELPTWVIRSVEIAVAATGVWALKVIAIDPWRKGQGFPSARSVIAWWALYIWWIPSIRLPEFFYLGVPLFHGLQQSAFFYRFETNRFAGFSRGPGLVTAAIAGGLIFFGFVTSYYLPMKLDWWNLGPAPGYFFFGFTCFIHIHHYFLDRVNWRLSDPYTRAMLFGSGVAT